MTINSGCSGQLCVSTNGPNYASYYLTNRRADGKVVVFEVNAELHKKIMQEAIPQRPIPGVTRDLRKVLVKLRKFYIDNNLTNGQQIWHVCEVIVNLEKNKIHVDFKYD